MSTATKPAAPYVYDGGAADGIPVVVPEPGTRIASATHRGRGYDATVTDTEIRDGVLYTHYQVDGGEAGFFTHRVRPAFS